MASATTDSQTRFVQTLPQLLALNKDFSDLNEQIAHAAHIIGLPENWNTIQEDQARSEIIRRLVRARAEWVLRWILDKLKDNADAGTRARANPKAWKLLDWMIQVLPKSRAAAQLREADFLSILERVLHENFNEENTLSPEPISQNAREDETSESSTTVQEEGKPSRKRKRQSPGIHASSKRVALHSGALETLFGAVFTVIESTATKAGLRGGSEEVVQTEHMKMALRTDSSQAARILKGWISAVNMLLMEASKAESVLPDARLDLSLALRIWELRAIDADDASGSSSDHFSAECLIPILILYDRIQDATKEIPSGQGSAKDFRRLSEDLETLLVRHLFAPARAAFFTHTTQSEVKDGPIVTKAEQLASNLTSLRAKILQAAQIQDTSVPIPNVFLSHFHSIPQLLDMVVRMSPSRTPKARITERPWIQAVFISLAECAGCPLETPEFPVPELSIKAVEESLRVLSLYDVKVDSDIITQLFQFHSGVGTPRDRRTKVHWPLVAALVHLDPSTFVSGPSSASSKTNGKSEDIARLLFDQISLVNQNRQLPQDEDEMDIDSDNRSDHQTSTTTEYIVKSDTILESVIFPVMSASARNRDLLGFIDRWDEQLCKHAPASRSALQERHTVVWEDRGLGLELERLLEQSLTIPQIMALFQRHAGRLNLLKKAENESDDTETIKKAYSSAVLLRALLWSIKSDEIIESLEPQLGSLLTSYTDIVCDKRCRGQTDQASCWMTLCRLLAILWPLKLHGSLEIQQRLLRPLIEQAIKDVSTARKKRDEYTVTSKTKGAALLFLLTVADHLRTVPGWDDTLGEALRKALKTLSPSRLEPTELGPILEIFCSEFAHLLEYFEPDSRKESLHKLIQKIADQGLEATSNLAGPLSQCIFTSASPALRETYADALLQAVELADEDVSILKTVREAILQLRPTSLPRDRRETVLNKIMESLISKSQDIELLLSVMISLQEAHNATSTISTDGGSFFGLAKSLHDKDFESDSILSLFQELMVRTLGHMLPNKDQAQNRRYLDAFESKLGSILKKPNRCFPARLAIVRAAWLAQKDGELVSWDAYLSLLAGCFANPSVPEETVLAAFNEISLESFGGHTDRYQAAQDLLRPRLSTETNPQLHGTGKEASTVPANIRVLRHALIAKFKLYPDMDWIVRLSVQLLRDVSVEQQDTVLRSIGNTFSSLTFSEQLGLVTKLTHSGADEDWSAPYRLLHALVSVFDDKLSTDAHEKENQLAILPTVCYLLGDSSTGSSFCALLDTIATIIREKPTFTSQHSIECVLAALVKLSSRNGPHLPSSEAEAIYTRICDTTRWVLLLHRSRLGGRFHLLLPLLQNLLFCFFIPHGGRQNMLPPWLRAQASVVPTHLTASNASQYARLLSTLCSPTQSSVSKAHQNRATTNTKSSLNDPVKAAREYVSHYIYPLLATLCRFQLNGRLESGVREKLMPGIWEVVGTAEMDKEALQGMYAGLDRSSREIWKGLWEEWKDHSKRRNGI